MMAAVWIDPQRDGREVPILLKASQHAYILLILLIMNTYCVAEETFILVPKFRQLGDCLREKSERTKSSPAMYMSVDRHAMLCTVMIALGQRC